MQKMGGLGALAAMMPGMKKAKAAMQASGMDDRTLLRMDAMISSMTAVERERPALLNARRKVRVAKGSGTTVQDVNRLLKMHKEMEGAMKKLRKMGGMKGLMGMLGGGGPGGGMPDPSQIGDMLGGGRGPGGGLPGLPGGLPPGFDKFGKK